MFFIIKWFQSLGKALQKAYDQLSTAEQSALQSGTGLVDIVNSNLGATPAALRSIIQKAFPTLSEQVLEASAFQVAALFGIKAANFDEAIVGIQAHLSGLKGATWETASHSAALLFSALFSGPDTKVISIVNLIEFAFQKFVKKSV